MASVQIELVSAPTDEVRSLIGALNDELSTLYTQEQRHGLALDALFQPHIRFFLARQNGAAMGCGGVALLDGFAEIKRMYVRQQARGQGAADTIMAKLIAETVQSGRTLLRLETGSQSFAAIGFYKRCGFQSCTAFEPYSSMPPAAIITSVFMERPVP
jgi:putative acetyltransferase